MNRRWDTNWSRIDGAYVPGVGSAAKPTVRYRPTFAIPLLPNPYTQHYGGLQ